MSAAEHLDVLVLGSGQAGNLMAWHMARSGYRTALIERRWIGGSCPNIACMPSKNEVWSARSLISSVTPGISERSRHRARSTWAKSASGNATW
ncbi:MAG: FAD-dependent oxidoreductase [Methylovirgula sp.]